VVKGAEQRYTRAWGLEKRDPAEAAYWYALAASDGEAKALTNLGIIVARGFGTTKPDPVDAMLLWHAAAARGEVFAMFNLGGLYERGIGLSVEQNEEPLDKVRSDCDRPVGAALRAISGPSARSVSTGARTRASEAGDLTPTSPAAGA